MMNLSKQIIGIMMLIGLFCAPLAQAEEWHYVFSPYLQAAGLDGTFGLAGHEVEASPSFGDVLSNLEFGFVGHFEAENGKWIILGDFTYLGLGVAVDTTVPTADIDINQWLIEGGAGYRFHPNVEALFGGRYNRVDGKINFHGPLGLRLQGDQNWFDPYIGGRLHLPISEKAEVTFRGDIGGFGVGSDFAWTITPAFLYNFKNNKYTLAAFYRWQRVDYENKDNGFKFDSLIEGPGFGLAMHF